MLLSLWLLQGPVDPRAWAVLVDADRKLGAVRTLSATCTHTLSSTQPDGRMVWIRQVTRVRLRRPNLAKLESSLESRDRTGKSTKIVAYGISLADGKTQLRAYPYSRTVDKWPDRSATGVLKMVVPLAAFFDPARGFAAMVEESRRQESIQSLRLVGQEMRGGSRCKVVRFEYRRPGSSDDAVLTLSIDPDGVARRVVYETGAGKIRGIDDLTDVKVDIPIPRSVFVYKIPAGFHASELLGTTQANLPVGAVVPDFVVDRLDGTAVRLSELRGKVVVLDFWATWCGNCIQGFPHLESLAKELGSKEVTVLAIDTGDTLSVCRKWVAQYGHFPSFVFAHDPNGLDGKGVAKLFGGIGLPTTYVIDREGKVAASFAGRDGHTDDAISNAVRETVARKAGR